MPSFDMKDYVPVNERIDAFYKAHPEGSMQSEIVELTAERVTVKAYAYRTLDDPRPGIGHSSLEIPGKTSFTKGSEIENAETSAWGRAIAALGFEVKRGVASAEEVRNKQQRTADPVGTDMRARLLEVAKVRGIDHAGLERYATEIGIPKGARATPDQLVALIVRIEGIEQPSSGVPPVPADGGAAPEGAALPTTPSSDKGSSEAATVQGSEDEAVSPGTSSDPAPAPTFADVLAVTGGAEVPPAPGTAAYRALPSGVERAAAKAYHEKNVERDPETLHPDTVQLGAPLA